MIVVKYFLKSTDLSSASSTSLPGGNLVDGLPPASSLRRRKPQNSGLELSQSATREQAFVVGHGPGAKTPGYTRPGDEDPGSEREGGKVGPGTKTPG